MIKILIVDDEEPAGNILKVLIEKFIAAPKEIRYCSSPEKGLEMLSEFKPSLVMLDIEMPHINGFDFLNKAVDYDFDVIFTTAYDQYAIKAIRFSALDYLLKPVDKVELQNAINRHIVKREFFSSQTQQQLVDNLLSNIKTNNTSSFKLAISVKDGTSLVETSDIICIEGISNYSRIHIVNQNPLVVSKTLKEYEDLLQDHGFIRVHKSYLVNKKYVRQLDKDGMILLYNDKNIPVSRRKKDEVMKLLTSG